MENTENRTKRLSNKESNRLTKECLQIALMKLMAEKPFEQISVTEITKRAGVSRTAYYRNYSTKEEILEEACREILEEDRRSLERFKGDWKNWYLYFFNYMRRHADKVQAALVVKNPITSYDILNEMYPQDSKFGYYANIARQGAFYAILFDWIEHGMKESDEEMASICMKLFNE